MGFGARRKVQGWRVRRFSVVFPYSLTFVSSVHVSEVPEVRFLVVFSLVFLLFQRGEVPEVMFFRWCLPGVFDCKGSLTPIFV